jgi:hypothetical protein
MKSTKNRFLPLATVCLGIVSFACGSAVDVASEDGEAVAASEQALNTYVADLYPVLSIGQVPKVGMGDADIYSQNGRTTNIKVSVKELKVEGANLKAHVIYQIEENFVPDHSILRWDNTVSFPLDPNWTVNQILSTAVDNTIPFPNKNWNWNQFPAGYNGDTSVLYDAWVKFDGSGMDDQGNAQAYLYFHFKLNVTTP